MTARILPQIERSTLLSDLGSLLADPATYALDIPVAVALLSYSTGLQRGTFTQATAPLVVAETIAPAWSASSCSVTPHGRAGAGWRSWASRWRWAAPSRCPGTVRWASRDQPLRSRRVSGASASAISRTPSRCATPHVAASSMTPAVASTATPSMKPRTPRVSPRSGSRVRIAQ